MNTEYANLELKAVYDASLEEGTEVKAPDASKHVEDMTRFVLSEKPRVTRFNIKWCVPLSRPELTGIVGRRARRGTGWLGRRRSRAQSL